MNNLQTNSVFDVIIIGGGAAGMSAALWCAELQLKALVLEKTSELGGQLLSTYNPIANHLGIETKNGREMRDVFVKQLADREFALKLSSEISQIDLRAKRITLAGGEIFSAGKIIIASGVSRRSLNVKGEQEFQNKGVIASGKREQAKASGKIAGIIGGGDAAFENALILAETAARVMLIHRSKNFRARPEFIERVKNHPKIEVLTETIVAEIIGNERVEAFKLKDLSTNETRVEPVETILIRIGVEPNSTLFREFIEIDENGYIKINHNCETNLDGILAVGDVANPSSPTVSTAVGNGATAAKFITTLLNR